MTSLEGKTALITGALGTIGLALVKRFAAEGAQVIAADRPDAANPQATLDRVAEGVRYFGCDLNDLEQTAAATRALAQEVGGIDILVNNAATVVNKPYDQFPIAEYEEELRVNSSAAFVLISAVADHMKVKKAGKIVCMTSLTLNGNWDGFVPYVASKGAVFGLVKSFARELGPHGINVNGVSPGAVLSDAEQRHYGDRLQEYEDWILDRQCIKRRIMPEDIANLTHFLCSSQADIISGQDMHCDGGW